MRPMTDVLYAVIACTQQKSCCSRAHIHYTPSCTCPFGAEESHPEYLQR